MYAWDLNNSDIILNISTTMISLQSFLQYCSAPLCFLSTFLYPFLSQSPPVSFIPFISSLLTSLLPYQTHVSLHASFFYLILCMKALASAHSIKNVLKTSPIKKSHGLSMYFVPLFYYFLQQGHLKTLLYNISRAMLSVVP